MTAKDDEEERLRTVALHNAQSILLARRRAEEQLRKQSEWLRITLASIGDAVISTDAEGRVSFMNGVAETLTGWPQSEAIGRPLHEVFRIINEHDRRPVENPALRALREGVIVGLANHTLLVARDGTERPIDDSAAPIRDGDGPSLGAVLVFRDVTERKRAEQERKNVEQALARVTAVSERRRRLYETILSSITDLVYVFDLDHRFTYANDALLAMWGRPWEDAIGKNCRELGYPDWQAALHDGEIEQVIAGKKPIRGEVPFTGTHGRRFYEYIFVPVFGADGEVEAVAGTARDTTERKQVEEELKDTDRKKDEFLALLAHELRNPLAPLRNGLQILRLSSDPGAVTQARSMMDRQLAHMVRLIDDLMDVSRISRNKMKLRRTRVTLADVINYALETARPQIDAAGLELSVALPRDPVYLDADLIRLAQVFGNLLVNGAKYTGRGGRIRIDAERQGSDLIVSVRDTGIGIPADALPRIFDMFSQVDRGIERSTGGLGIGLALVKSLVEMHQGTVAATSEGPGKGATFTIKLPALDSPAPPLAVPGADPAPISAGPRRRILVVDDNRDSAVSMAMLLKTLGNEVRQAHDGLEAVASAEAFRPHVMLMDVGMPRLNGLDATRRIRAQPWGRSIVIIALTGWGHEEDKQRSQAAGCDGHLVKPVHWPDLQKLLDELTGPKRG